MPDMQKEPIKLKAYNQFMFPLAMALNRELWWSEDGSGNSRMEQAVTVRIYCLPFFCYETARQAGTALWHPQVRCPAVLIFRNWMVHNASTCLLNVPWF